MLICILFCVSILLSFCNTFLNKRFQLGFDMSLSSFVVYNLINAALASVYFFIMNGFHMSMNFITLLYSAIFACNVILLLILGIKTLSAVSVSASGIFTTAGSVILSALFGLFFLGEPASPRLILSLAFMLTAVLLPIKKLRGSGQKSRVSVCLAQFLCSGASVIIQKLYTLTPDTCDTQSFFLMTNLLIVIFCTAVLPFFVHKNQSKARNTLMPFSKKQLLNIALRTLISNISSIITVILLSSMNVSVYTVISSALGILSGAFLSVAVFRERQTYESLLAVICAVLAIAVKP